MTRRSIATAIAVLATSGALLATPTSAFAAPKIPTTQFCVQQTQTIMNSEYKVAKIGASLTRLDDQIDFYEKKHNKSNLTAYQKQDISNHLANLTIEYNKLEEQSNFYLDKSKQAVYKIKNCRYNKSQSWLSYKSSTLQKLAKSEHYYLGKANKTELLVNQAYRKHESLVKYGADEKKVDYWNSVLWKRAAVFQYYTNMATASSITSDALNGAEWLYSNND